MIGSVESTFDVSFLVILGRNRIKRQKKNDRSPGLIPSVRCNKLSAGFVLRVLCSGLFRRHY